MFLKLSPFIVLALATVSFANPLHKRQATTNEQVSAFVSSLSQTSWDVLPDLLVDLAGENTSADVINPKLDQLTEQFNTTAASFASMTPTSGSNTTAPTNDDISVMFGDVLFLLAGDLSGFVNPDVNADIPAKFAELDTSMAAAARNLNTTIIGTLAFVHIQMLDAKQFLALEGFNQTLAALGF